MKAIVITQPGDASVLQLKDEPMPVPGDEEVLIKVIAAGVNRPDVAQRKGQYPAPPNAPQFIPGLEVAGIIQQCGSSVTKWKAGDEVCALLAGGGYATHTIAHQHHCLPKPPNISFAEAASLPETVFTVWSNVFERGKLNAGENFLVHGGSSGIGITAIQLAKAFGAHVYATAGSAEKCTACELLGAIRCINYKQDDFESALKEVKMDVVLDMIGGEYFSKNISLLNNDGRLVYINAMNGAEVQLNIMQVMRKRIHITGSTLRNRENSFKAQLAEAVKENVWPLIAQGNFKPVVHSIFPLAHAADAHRLLEGSSHIGKIVLQVIEE